MPVHTLTNTDCSYPGPQERERREQLRGLLVVVRLWAHPASSVVVLIITTVISGFMLIRMIIMIIIMIMTIHIVSSSSSSSSSISSCFIIILPWAPASRRPAPLRRSGAATPKGKSFTIRDSFTIEDNPLL